MKMISSVLVLFLLAIVACENKIVKHEVSIPDERNDFHKIVGRWADVAVIINGEDLPRGGVTQQGPVAYYTFNSDSTFMITVGDSIKERGKWFINSNASPKTFDHTDHLVDAPYVVPGIYELGEDMFKICIWTPNKEMRRPTRFESKAENGSWILIFKRASE